MRLIYAIWHEDKKVVEKWGVRGYKYILKERLIAGKRELLADIKRGRGLTQDIQMLDFIAKMNTKYRLIIVIVVVAGAFSYLIWGEYFSYDYMDDFAKFEEQYVEAMTADTYGGKTPQETLNLFIAALKEEDIGLAVKYFMYDDHLSKEKWANELNELKSQGLLDETVGELEIVKTDPSEISDENDHKFALYKNGQLYNLIDMQFNTFSKVWKIESL